MQLRCSAQTSALLPLQHGSHFCSSVYGGNCFRLRSSRKLKFGSTGARSSSRRTAGVHVNQQLQLPRETAVTDPQQTLGGHDIPQHVDETVPGMWSHCAVAYGDMTAVYDPHASPPTSLTYKQLRHNILMFAAGLQSLGLTVGDKVSLFSENSWRWLVCDQGIMMSGAADAVRGTSSTADELRYILSHSDSVGLVVQDAETLKKVMQQGDEANGEEGVNTHNVTHNGAEVKVPQLRFVIQLWGQTDAGAQRALGCPVLTFDQLMARGEEHMSAFRPVNCSSGDLATIVYTSGTTGNPKGVMLTHGNLMYQVKNMYYYLNLAAGEKLLSLLPPWHIYERTVSYFVLSRGCQVTYINIRKFREDLTKYPPDYFVCVPLVLDTLHHKVMLAMKTGSVLKRKIATTFLSLSGTYIQATRTLNGTNLDYAKAPAPLLAVILAAITSALLYPLHSLGHLLVYRKIRDAIGIKKCVVSGGGSLAAHLDKFYEVIGLPILNGWGLTETSPVLACRRNQPHMNVRGTVGRPMPGTQIRVVDPSTLQEVKDGEQGLLLAKGPGVTSGYYRDESATAGAFRAGSGWFDTGDLGWKAPLDVVGSKMGGTITLTGRAKDTIVLTSGKNIEPQPLEDAIQCSPLIRHAVVVGHDHRALGVLLDANTEELKQIAQQRDISSLDDMQVAKLLQAEVNKALHHRAPYEQIHHLAVLDRPLSVENGTLTRTMKARRPQIMTTYKQQVDALLKKLR